MTRRIAVALALMTGLLAIPLLAVRLDEPFTVTLVSKVAILGMAGVGLNLALGYGGLVSFGHAAFFGLGGYVSGVLANHALTATPLLSWPIALTGTTAMLAIWPTAIAVGGLAALAIGALSLRTSGVYFIMITLAFAQMLFYFAVSWPAYGGEDGLPIYLRSTLPGINTMDPLSFFGVCFGLLAVVLAFSGLITASRFGLALSAVRQNPARLAAAGIAPYRVRLVAFVLSGMITALAGALYADLNRFVSPAMLSWQTSGEIIVLVILGGVGRLFGPLAGAALLVTLEHWLGGVSDYWQLMLGLLLLLVVLFARGGIVGWLAPVARDG